MARPKQSLQAIMGRVDIYKQSKSTKRLVKDFCFGDPYENLANAIICTAADDYVDSIVYKNDMLRESLETFFKSAWYRSLTRVNGPWLMILLQKRAKAIKWKRFKERQQRGEIKYASKD